MTVKKPEHKAEHKPAAKAEPAKPVVPSVPKDHVNPGPIPPESSWQDSVRPDKPAVPEVDRAVARLATIKPTPPPDRHDHEVFEWANAAADDLERECCTHEGRKAFYAGDGVARATVLRDQALALAARFSEFIRA